MIFKVIIGSIAISFALTILLVFGDSPSFRNTPVQKARIQLLKATSKISQLYELIDSKSNGRLLNYLAWVVPVGYLIVVSVCFQQFLQKTLSMLSTNLFQLGYILISMMAVFASTIACIFSDPGQITQENLKGYPYHPNQLIFFKNKFCHTCQAVKPARSKHCSTCGHCYLLYDHHCVWVNNCIGLRNYKWFMLFLFANINMLAYGDVLCYAALSPQIKSLNGMWQVITKTTDANKVTGIFVILCSIFVVIAIMFTTLQFRYIYLGVTTNELDKWSEIEHLISYGILFKVDPPINDEPYVEKASYNGRVVYISLKDEKVLIDANNESQFTLTLVESVQEDIDNIYDRGFWQNLKERF